jgi:hypothetical protein
LGRRSGRRFPGHCLSVLALIVRWIAARATLVHMVRALPCRHCCQSAINTVTRHRAQRACSTRGRSLRRIPCHHTPGSSDLPSCRTSSSIPGQDPQYPHD